MKVIKMNSYKLIRYGCALLYIMDVLKSDYIERFRLHDDTSIFTEETVAAELVLKSIIIIVLHVPGLNTKALFEY